MMELENQPSEKYMILVRLLYGKKQKELTMLSKRIDELTELYQKRLTNFIEKIVND